LQQGHVLLDQQPATAARTAHPAGRERLTRLQLAHPKPDRLHVHPRRPRRRRDPTPAIRARLRRRPQAALSFIQLARQRPEPLADRLLIDPTPQF